ncbi:MAG: hypothetical protein AAF821_13770 [Cyanobacteria bacterium P01_D01_bin.156]
MEQLKYTLGPFELFAAIIGGSPFVVAGILLHYPVKHLGELVPLIQQSSSVAIALTALFLSYIAGGTVQSISWPYFVRLCRLFNKNFLFLGDELIRRNQTLPQQNISDGMNNLVFEDRLVLQLRKHIGIPKKLSWMDGRLMAYLRENNSPSMVTAEGFVASHIMYRNLSLGCLLLCLVSLVNGVRLGSPAPLLLIPILLYAAYLMFRQAVNFKLWQNRELLLGFYFASTKESSPEDKS